MRGGGWAMMSGTEKAKLVHRLVGLSYTDACAVIENLPEQDRGEVARALQSVGLRAAWLGAYADERYGYGAGDQGHAKGVKEANKVGRKLWLKLLGYCGYTEVNPPTPKRKGVA